MKKGFTLAEVLITLVIIGVIAAMTIPTLMNSTNQQEFRTGLKKAISTLNQAMSLNYALEGRQVGDNDLNSGASVVDNLFKKRMSVISTATTDVPFATTNSKFTTITNNSNLFYTADGMRFAVEASGTAKGYDADADEYYYGYMIIDVNGDKGPNSMTTDAASPRDTYVATVYGNRVVAGYTNDDTTNCSTAAKQIMFDKKTAKKDLH